MANGHGGARIGAGQKKKALSDKLVEGNPGKRKLTVMEFTDTADLQGETMPPPRDYLAARQKNGKELLAVEVYERTWTWLHERGCAHLIPAQILEQYAMAISRWIQCEECITEYGFLAKHPTTGNAIPSPYVSMSQSFSKQANNLWFQIYQVVRENCSTEYKGATPHDDMMERLLSARRGGLNIILFRRSFMNIIQLPLGEVHPYKNNPRKNDGAVDAVAESIKQYGFLVPLVISADHEIITGHTRFKAAKKLGLSSVPCVIADELTEEQIKAFRLVDNKVGELAEWDVDLLPLELADIAQDLSPFGFETISEDEFGEEFTLDSGEKKPYQQISLTLHDKQAELILACIDYVHTHGEVKETFGNENHKGNGVYEVVRQWAEQKKLV